MSITIEEDISLKDFTTFKIGGEAGYFVRVSSVLELKEAIDFAKKERLPYFILGGGSNVLVSDEGFSGLVIKMEMGGIKFSGNEVVAGAGVNWDELVAKTVEEGLFGLENLSLIPGTVGASAVQNIGAYGVEAKDKIAWVEAIDFETGELVFLTKEQCNFGYRTSLFKRPEGKKHIITRVAFSLSKNGILNTDYKDVSEYILKNNIKNITQKELREAIIYIRKNKLPDLNKLGTAGSFFKNPVISEELFLDLSQRFSGLSGKKTGDGMVKVPLAWIFDNICGFKGVRAGAVGVYENQALVLVNYGGAGSQDILALAEEMADSVKEKTGIDIEREVEII